MVLRLFTLSVLFAVFVAQSSGNTQTDGAYGDPQKNELYRFLPPCHGSAPWPVVVFHPGVGGNLDQILNLPDVSEIGKLLRENGVAIFAITTPKISEGYYHPTQIHSAANAVQFLRASAASFQIDPQRVAFWGISYGSYVLGSLTYGKNYQDALVNTQQSQSTRPLFLMNQNGLTNFSLMDPSFTGSWFGMSQLTQVPAQTLQEASFSQLVLSVRREFTPRALSYYKAAIGGGPPPFSSPHDWGLMEDFHESLQSFSQKNGLPEIAQNSPKLLNLNPPPAIDIEKGEAIVAWAMKQFGIQKAMSLGGASMGSQGPAQLSLSGEFLPGETVEFEYSSSTKQGSVFHLVAGNAKSNVPTCAGILMPSVASFVALATDAQGQYKTSTTLPSSWPLGLVYYSQALQLDLGVSCGFVLSNALRVE